MRLVEFYDREYLENVVSLLHGEYDGVTYVSFSRDEAPTRREQEALTWFLRQNCGVEAQFITVEEYTVEGAAAALRALTARDGPWVFDITGGSPLFAAVAGVLFAEDGGERVCLQGYDAATGGCSFRCPTALTLPRRQPPLALTVTQALTLRGISILNEKGSIRPDLDRDGLRAEVLRLWEVVRHDLKGWNAFCSASAETHFSQDWVQVEKRAPLPQAETCGGILKALERHKLVSHWKTHIKNNRVSFSYRLHVAPSVYFLYDKAGNLLEMLTYLSLMDSGRFHDCCVGVKLDWDARYSHKEADPFNELDVVATRGHIPYFISCKNTQAENDYLYEISTMTRHFGGAYAVPVLVTTMDCHLPIQIRAREMGVLLIEASRFLSARDVTKRLLQALA